MALIFDVAVLLFLCFIAIELRFIHNELTKLPRQFGGSEEKKDSSPTINVNVGALPAGSAAKDTPAEKVKTPPESALALEAAGAQKASQPIEPPEPIPEPRRVMATTSGLVVVKCPACQAENSSYRSECFNCGAPLH